jgi:heme-degrading monooxygenase HmoA
MSRDSSRIARPPGSVSPESAAFPRQAGRKQRPKQYRETDDTRHGGAVILRVWRAKIVPERVEAYRRFNRERCLPMLRKQPGFLGVLFSWQAGGCAAISVTIWEDAGAVGALRSSPSYRRAVRELAESGLLAGEQSVELLEVEGGELRPEALLGTLARTTRAPS